MALKNKSEIKINKAHQGKEFGNGFHFVGLVKPVRKKDNDSDNWFDVEIFDTNKTKTGKDRRVLQFNIETAFKNELKVELAGMEMPLANVYSSKHKKNFKIDWSNRNDKTKYPDDTYHLIETDWDKAERMSNSVHEGMWVEVKGKYEFSSFTTDEGKDIISTKRIIEQLFPLKNGEVVITGLNEGDTFKAYDSPTEGLYLGMGKADKEGVASIKVGWLNPTGGKVYICKLDGEVEGARSEQVYTDGVNATERITTKNNITGSIRLPKASGSGFDYVPYVRNFKDESFTEINSFEMQIGIKSTYQDEATKDTLVNAVYLDYGKAKSTPYDVELKVFHKEQAEGTPYADAFARLNQLDFLTVEGIDNNRAERSLIEVEEKDDDNPFADVSDKTVIYEEVTSGTKKGLEILRYVQGTYIRELLNEEEISKEDNSNVDPFGNTNGVIEIEEDQLPF